jgi:hypothetical protein
MCPWSSSLYVEIIRMEFESTALASLAHAQINRANQARKMKHTWRLLSCAVCSFPEQINSGETIIEINK